MLDLITGLFSVATFTILYDWVFEFLIVALCFGLFGFTFLLIRRGFLSVR